MRGWMMAGLMVCAVACAPASKKDAEKAVETASASAGCELSTVAPIALTGAAATDTIEARAFGATCARATLVITLRDASGAVMHADAVAASEAITPNPAGSQLDGPQVQAFIDAWSRPEILTASAAPSWSEGQPRPGGDNEPLILTDMIRPMYEDVRRQNLKVICYLSGASEKTCLYAKPTGGVVEVMYRARA